MKSAWFSNKFQELCDSQGGSALVEFAFAFPVLMTLASSGIELANYAITARQVSDTAMQIADNASRIGSQSVLTNKPISEAEINDLFLGAKMQASNLSLDTKAKVILSSLETNADGGQWIHWQRCINGKAATSSYGNQGDGATGTSVTGMGPAGKQVKARPDTAVMFVEINYTYTPIAPFMPFSLNSIGETASFNVRDDRDLSTMPQNSEKVPIASCR